MTLSEIRTEVRAYVKRPETVTDAQLTMWINWAQRYIARTKTFREMMAGVSQTLTKGKYVYEFPDRMKDMYIINLLNGTDISKVEYAHYTEMPFYVDSSTSRCPTHYTDNGSQLYFYPIPDKTYTAMMYISRFPSKLVADGDRSELSDKDDLIVMAAVMFGLTILREDKEIIKSYGELFSTLYQSAILGEPVKPDWKPTITVATPAPNFGEYWTDPFIKRS